MNLKTILLTIVMIVIVLAWIGLIIAQGFGIVFWIGLSIIGTILFFAWLVISANKELN